MRIRGAAVVPVPIIYPLGHGLIWPSPTLHVAFTSTGISRCAYGSIVGDVGRGVHVIPDKTAEFMLEIIRLRVTLRVGLFLDIIVKRIGINFVVGVPIYLIVVVHRSEEHTSELQSRENLVCRLLLEKKKKKK